MHKNKESKIQHKEQELLQSAMDLLELKI